jgi:hypothetical protein
MKINVLNRIKLILLFWNELLILDIETKFEQIFSI